MDRVFRSVAFCFFRLVLYGRIFKELLMTMPEKLANYYDLMLPMQPKPDDQGNERQHGGYAVVFIRDDLNEPIWGEYDFPKGVYRVRSIVRDAIHWQYIPKEVTSP